MEIIHHPFFDCLGIMRLHSLACSCTLFFCSRSLRKASQPSRTTTYSQQYWILNPEERSHKTWHISPCPRIPVPSQLQESLRAWAFECSSCLCHSFGWMFGPDHKYSHQRKKIKPFMNLVFQLTQPAHCLYQAVILCLRRQELDLLHHIWLVSMVFMHNSFDSVPWNLAFLSNCINVLSGVRIDNFLYHSCSCWS